MHMSRLRTRRGCQLLVSRNGNDLNFKKIRHGQGEDHV